MSTDTIVQKLNDVDKTRERLISKLPWFTRMRRRFWTGDAFKAYNISTVMTWPGAFITGLSFSKLWASWVITHPAATAFAAKIWGVIVALFAAAVAIVSP